MSDEERQVRLEALNRSVESMQGRVFYCEDDEGVLRRWYPPRPVHRDEKYITTTKK